MKTFKIENTPKINTGFKTPEHYFENFSDKLMLQIQTEDVKVVSLFERRKTILFAVAAILIIALMLPLINMQSKSLNKIDEATLENYISYQSNINQYDLINELAVEDIQNINTTSKLDNDAIEDILATNNNLEHLIIE